MVGPEGYWSCQHYFGFGHAVKENKLPSSRGRASQGTAGGTLPFDLGFVPTFGCRLFIITVPF